MYNKSVNGPRRARALARRDGAGADIARLSRCHFRAMLCAYRPASRAPPQAQALSSANAVRIALTLIAVALVAALSAALVAPLFVDWSAQRGFVESELGRQFGARVAIAGPIEARLLPTPYLTMEDVTVGDAGLQGTTTLRAKKIRLELALGALAGGRFRFTQIDLDQPVARIAANAEGKVQPVRSGIATMADRIAFDRLVVRHGQIVFARTGAGEIALADVDFDGSAKSLIGPFRGTGKASAPLGDSVQFEFATMEIAGAALPIKAEIVWPRGGPTNGLRWQAGADGDGPRGFGRAA